MILKRKKLVESKEEFVCKTCDSNNIEQKAWVNVNDSNSFVEYIDDDNGYQNNKSNYYCGNCQDLKEVVLKTVKIK